MMQFRGLNRSLVAFSTTTKILVYTARNCRISRYVNKYFFSTIIKHDVDTMSALSLVS